MCISNNCKNKFQILFMKMHVKYMQLKLYRCIWVYSFPQVLVNKSINRFLFVCSWITFTSASFVDNLDFNFECSFANRSSIRSKLQEFKVLWAIFATFSTNEETLLTWTSPEIENSFYMFISYVTYWITFKIQ